MALLIFLKQPNTAIAAEGDRKILDKTDFKKVFLLNVTTFEGNSMFIATDNIAYIRIYSCGGCKHSTAIKLIVCSPIVNGTC